MSNPVRKISKNYRNVTGVLTNPKTQTRHEFESTLERDFLLLLNFNNLVISYQVQPVRISWLDQNNKLRHYTPDVRVFYQTNRPFLIEIKYRSELHEKWSELKPKFKAAIAYCRQQGWRFKIITEVEVRGIELKNIKFLNGYLTLTKDDIFESKCNKLLEILNELTQTTVDELLALISKDKLNHVEWIPMLWYLVAR